METRRAAFTEWYPLELQYIKALFLLKQYRPCIKACREVLDTGEDGPTRHPVQATFVHFYLGLAHDELARAMHSCSQAKIPAFNQAEQFYRTTLNMMPISEQSMAAFFTTIRDSSDAFMAPDGYHSHHANSQPATSPDPHATDTHSPQYFRTHIRTDSLPTRSPQAASRSTTDSDLSDLESHDSFDEIITPHKLYRHAVSLLPRDVSSMSLLEAPQRHPPTPARSPLRLERKPPSEATSQGLMRPIRPGSPPKQYHVPPKLPYVGATATRAKASQLPKLRIAESIPEQPSSSSPSIDASPVSPLGSDSVTSDTSTISPISPETPTVCTGPGESKTKVQDVHKATARRIEEHFEAMREQLATHLDLLQRAKEQAIKAQADRAVARAAAPPSTGTPLSTITNQDVDNPAETGGTTEYSDEAVRRVPPSRNFWPSTPPDQKTVEKQTRIEAGRARGWKRERFHPARYVQLAERALGEL